MGLALWMAAGGAAWIVARIVPAGRTAGPAAEIATALVAASVAGAVATGADFGGWNEPDWRAGLLTFFCAAAAIATLRLFRLTRRAA